MTNSFLRQAYFTAGGVVGVVFGSISWEIGFAWLIVSLLLLLIYAFLCDYVHIRIGRPQGSQDE